MAIEVWGKGIINLGIEADKIPAGAASNSLGWRTRDTSIELIRGKVLFGAEETDVDKVKGYHIGFKNDGTAVHFRKIDATIQYFNTATELWVDVVTGLTASAFYTFADFTTVAGTFVYATGSDGVFKIHTASPGSSTNLTDTAKSPTGTDDYGKNMISESRMFCFDLEKNRAGLYMSFIDSGNYTTVSSEAIGSSGSTNYPGTLAFKAGDSDRTSFATVFTDGTQTMVDDKNGGFTGDGTGTIDYTTGVYDITFNATTTGSVTADYQWEDSNDGGLTDFTFTSPTRVAGEGDFFPQEVGGARIQNVFPFDNKFYSVKDRSVYELDLTADDTNATNKVFNSNIGSLHHNSSVPTSKGIILLDTSNPNRPQLIRLGFNITGDKLIPTELAPNFDFSKYEWDECIMITFGEDIVFTGKEGSTVNNRVFRYNSRLKSIDVHEYHAQTLSEDAGELYMGDSLTRSTYKLFDGFDDDEFSINNFWEGRDEKFGTESLKRYREIDLKGLIAIDQAIEVFESYDGGGDKLIGTIEGSGSYVDRSNPHTIGSTEIGESEIGGGGSGQTAFFYYRRMKVNTPKFGRRKLKFKATGLGFASVSFIDEQRVQLSAHGRKIPHKYR